MLPPFGMTMAEMRFRMTLRPLKIRFKMKRIF